MSIRVGKYNYKTKTQPKTNNFENVLIHTTGSLSPYVMKDKNNILMENFWQFSKVWNSVNDITQPINMYQSKSIRWKHPEEIHIEQNNDNLIKLTPEYWKWREKGFSHDKWVSIRMVLRIIVKSFVQ